MATWTFDWSPTDIGPFSYPLGCLIDSGSVPSGVGASYALWFTTHPIVNSNDQLTVDLTFTAAGTISFYRRVSSEPSFDGLKFYIDGVQQSFDSGTVAWGKSADFAVTAGTHTFKWAWVSDGSGSVGSNDASLAHIVATNVTTPSYSNVTDTYNFESGTVPSVFTGSWTASSTTPITGTYSLQAPATANGTTSAETLTPPVSTASYYLQFDYKTSTELNADNLNVVIGGRAQAAKFSGISSGTSPVYVIPAGQTAVINYTKDSSGTAGSDTVWIDNVTMVHAATVTTPTVTGSAPVSVASSSASTLTVGATGSAPVSVGASSAAALVGGVATATGSAPVSVGSSVAAKLTVTVTGSAPVAVGGSSNASMLGGATGTAPITVGSSNIVGNAAGVSATIPLGLRIDVLDVQKLTVKTLSTVSVPVAMGLTVSSVVPVIPLSGEVSIPLGLSLVARPSDTVGADPRTGRRQWRYVVTDLAGNPLGELPRLEHDPVGDGVNEPATMDFTIATDDPSRALIKPIERQCQVWEGSRLLLRGPILPGRTSDDGATVTHQIHDPSWYWRGGRRVIGRIPRLDLLFNGDFTNGLAGWTPGFDADSIPAVAPTVTVVADDFSNDDDGLDPIKAAQIVGVESFTETKSTLDSAAVFYPNRPFSWEPLAAGFIVPGGAGKVDAVATAMPSTAGLKVTIVGHTANDGTGSGVALSLRRAQAAAARVAAIRPGAVITTKGVGFYDPDPAYSISAPQQRRVVISYQSTVTVSAKSKQWIRQTVEVMQPKSARYPLELTAAAMVKVADDWSVQDANMVALKVVARRKTTPSVIWQESSTSLSDTDPVERYIGESTSVTIPADDRTYLVDVYLYAAAALTRYAMVGLFPAEALYFWGTDQALIVKGIAEHMQSTALGHGNLNVGTRTPLTGIKRDRTYAYREHMPVETALDEFSSLNRGMDIDTLCTANSVTIATFYPRQGQVLDYVLVQGGQIVRATPATTRDVGSSIIAQAQDIGSYRAEAYASDPAAFGGLMLERVITAEQETPLNELGETAKAELGWASTSTVAYWVDIDPKRMAEVLANTNKGDTVRLVLDAPDQVDSLARIVKREIHPSGLRLMLALEE